MVKIGMMIGDRYEILEKIGTGGMSDVYKAKCHKLNRYVAVKVLKQEFCENANFVSKFRIEAQAAAGLMHPNIVNVYDVGEEGDIHYFVMELVEGITLKKYIEKKARLSYKEAVSIAIQVSMGIDAAHNNHIIHRDIKPQNIIISKDGKVKVTDFGIAKAATSNTITSNVMGSVHYTSPEQARGGYSDEKSDIYSLGITLFEMLTGRVPFNGETTVAIAIKHIQEELPYPSDFVQEIPVCVENIVLKCCQKSPDRRYQNMTELIKDLKQSLVHPEDDFVVLANPDTEGGTRAISDGDMAQIKKKTAYGEEGEGEFTGTMRLRTEELHNRYGDEDVEEEGNYNPRMEKITTWLTIIGGVVICIIILILALKVFAGMGDEDSKLPTSPVIPTQQESQETTDTTETETKVTMPKVVGLPVDEARMKLKGLRLEPRLEYEESETVEKDIVIRTDIGVGASIPEGTEVTLTISAGTKGIEVPYVQNLSYDAAYSKLTAEGFLVNRADNYSSTVEKGYVISQSPLNGQKVPEGSVITLTVSLGKEKVKVPKLVGMTGSDGMALITANGLKVGEVSYIYSSDVAEGYICYQSYSADTYVDPGTAIDIKVSQGAQPVTYKYNGVISALTVEEAPDYVSGSEVALKMVADDGQVLLETNTNTFPHPVNCYGINVPTGTLTMTYKVTKESTITTDPETGETVTTPGETVAKTVTRKIEFVRE
ncbi:MAG: Stk1 family PASTA domain-containing Ser/Thr kinase [Lachnospiraceae bacterium]|nr:Stk1 family PASTA domain-containing Ser/Thr kinase [Lachnospiraceae bacterium]